VAYPVDEHPHEPRNINVVFTVRESTIGYSAGRVFVPETFLFRRYRRCPDCERLQRRLIRIGRQPDRTDVRHER